MCDQFGVTECEFEYVVCGCEFESKFLSIFCIYNMFVGIDLTVNVEKCFSSNGSKLLYFLLTFSVPIPAKKKKITLIVIFALLCGASKGFIKAFKAFMKPFEVSQRSVKIKI